MGLKERIASLLGVGALVAVSGNGVVFGQEGNRQPAPVEGRGYDVVSVDQLLERESAGGNVLELYVKPVRRDNYDSSSEILAWSYTARYGNASDDAIGYRFLPELIDGVRKDVVNVEKPFTGLLLYTYNLTRSQRNMLAEGLGIGRVAYLETPPPARESSSGGVRSVDLGGFIISTGGSRGLTIIM